MRYDGDYAESVRSSISSAINNLATCITDTTNIPSIPNDFERSQDINNVISGIQSIKLDDINSEIESVIEGFEGTEGRNQALAALLKNPFDSLSKNLLAIQLELKKRMEEYKKNRRYNSKEELTQAYINGEISRDEYYWYHRIWDMSPEELVKLSKTLPNEHLDEILRIRSMNHKELPEIKLLKDIFKVSTIENKNLTRFEWTIKYTNRDGTYGIKQGIYKKHMWYETPDGTRISRYSAEYKEAVANGIELTPKHDSFIDERIQGMCERHPELTKKEALEILECIDTNGGMCSIASSAEAIAYQYADKLSEFEKQFGFPLYDENYNLNDEIYIELYMYSNWEILAGISPNDNIVKKVVKTIKASVGSNNFPNSSLIEEETGGMHLVTDQVTIQRRAIIGDTFEIPESFASSDSYEMKVETIYSDFKPIIYDIADNIVGNPGGNISGVKVALECGNSVTLSMTSNDDTPIAMADMDGNVKEFTGGHQVNVIDIKGNDIYIDTWGGIYKIDIEELKENTSYFDFTSYELVKK